MSDFSNIINHLTKIYDTLTIELSLAIPSRGHTVRCFVFFFFFYTNSLKQELGLSNELRVKSSDDSSRGPSQVRDEENEWRNGNLFPRYCEFLSAKNHGLALDNSKVFNLAEIDSRRVRFDSPNFHPGLLCPPSAPLGSFQGIRLVFPAERQLTVLRERIPSLLSIV